MLLTDIFDNEHSQHCVFQNMAGGGTANGKEKEKGSKEKKRRDESGDSSDSSPDRSKSKKKQSRDGRSSKKRCALSNNLKTLKRCLYSSFTHIPLCRRDSSSSSSSSSDSSSESSSDSSSDSSRSVVCRAGYEPSRSFPNHLQLYRLICVLETFPLQY